MNLARAKNACRLPSVLVCLFFILLLLIGLVTVSDYSAPFDELTEMQIFLSNVKEYAYRLGGPEGTGFFAQLPGEMISQRIERDHGICAYYPLIPFVPSIIDNTHSFSTAWSLLTWLWFMVGCISLYGFMRQMRASRLIACGTALLLYLTPRFFAEGHYNNKDVVLLCLMLLSLWLGARLLHKPTLLRGLLFSFAGAMSTNIKIVGAMPWGLVGLAVVLSLTLRHAWNKRMRLVAIATVLSYVGFYMLLTPAIWNAPLEYITYLMSNATRFSRFGGNVLFRGADFYDVQGSTPLPWYYIPYYIITTVPLFILALTLCGQVYALRLIWPHADQRRPSQVRLDDALLLGIATLSWLLPLAYAMLGRPIVYNGWRHFYFTYAGMLILAGYGMQRLWERKWRKPAARRVYAVLLAGCLCLTGAGIVLNHPFEFAYFNVLQPRDSQYTMDLDYWHAGAAGAFQRLYELKKNDAVELHVGCYYSDIKIGEFKLPEYMADRLIVSAEKDAPYLYYNSTYAHNYWAVEPPEHYHVLFKCVSYGNTFSVMYERDN